MPSDSRTEIEIGDVKSIGTMRGEVFVNSAYSHEFKADIVNYLNNNFTIQIYGNQGKAQQSTTIAVSLRAQTPSGSYKFGDSQITDLTYDPPSGEASWKVTGGGVNVTFHAEGKRVSGTLQVLATRDNQTLDAQVDFDIRN